jgi:lysophospholipase L1-like esterase
MILFIGDSLAVGTPLSQHSTERVVKRAQVGIGTENGVRSFLHPVSRARVVVVSLGTNDFWRPENVVKPAKALKRSSRSHKFCLLWVKVDGVANSGEINAKIRSLDIKMVPYSSSTVHPTPSGYVRRAQTIVKSVKKHCPRPIARLPRMP